MTMVHSTMNLESTETGGPRKLKEDTPRKHSVSLNNIQKLLLQILMEKNIQLMAL